MTEIKTEDALDLDAIEARVEATPKGPWFVEYFGDEGYPQRVENHAAILIADTHEGGEGLRPIPEFVAHARTDVPALVAEVKRLRDRVEELEPYEPHLREMHMGPGGWSMTIQQAKSASGAFVAAAKAMLDGYDAENYVEQEVFLGATTKERYMIIYVRPGKKGPHQLRREAEAKVTSLLRDMATVARHIEDGEYGDADKAARQALGIAPGVDLPGRES